MKAVPPASAMIRVSAVCASVRAKDAAGSIAPAECPLAAASSNQRYAADRQVRVFFSLLAGGPARSTMRIRSAAFLAASLSMMRARCTSTVRGEMPRSRRFPCWKRRSRSAPALRARARSVARDREIPAPEGFLRCGPAARRRWRRGCARPQRRIERLFDEILRTIAYRIDRGRNVVAAQHDQHRRRIMRRVEPLQHVNARATGQVGYR